MQRHILSVAFGLLLATAAFPLTLADNGRALAIICLPDNPAPAEQTAAEELCAHLEKITGAPFKLAEPGKPVTGPRIILGNSNTTQAVLGKQLQSLAADAFIVKVAGQNLLLVGGSPRGTLYAVYSFLEDDLGYRWLTWFGTDSIPQQKRLVVGNLSRVEKPAFAVRDMCVQGGVPGARRPDVARFLARNRDQGPDFNFLGDAAPYGGTSHRYGRPPGIWMVHTFFGWMPPDKYFAEHPEYYSLIRGERRKSQLCFTNPGLRHEMTANILKGMGETDPEANYAVSAQDDVGKLCECPDCEALVKREGTPGAPLFDYLVELGNAVKTRYPKAFISTLAYRKEQTEPPPQTLRLPDNVVIIFAPIDDNFAQPIEHESNAATLRNISEWPRHTSHLWVWYYPNTYGDTLPLGNLDKLAADFRLFKKVGVEGLFPEHDTAGVYRSLGLADLQNWVMFKLMWNPDQDLQKLITDFTDRYYGPAAPLIREYSARLEADTRKMPERMSWNAPAAQFRHLTPELILWSERLFDRAEATVASDPVILMRVKQARLGMDLAALLNWDAVRQQPGHGLTRDGLIKRYRDTYIATVRANIDPKYVGNEVLQWHMAVKDELSPLPAPLDQIPAARVRQFTPQGARLHGRGRLVADPDAAAGIAAELDTDGKVPANLGFYDVTKKRQQHAWVGKDAPLVTGKYQLIPIGRTALNEQCYVWFDWTWLIQFEAIAQLYDRAHPDKQWEVYASVKYDGPGYGGTAPKNTIRVDRVIAVESAD
ncbi:MAG: DUF4838 domain-containing protein [Armatimonadia bacterium]